MPTNRLYLFFALNYLAQGLGGFAYEPLSYFLKERLGLDAAGAAAFVAWMTLPFALKPLLGLLTDALPIGGSRRRWYLFGASLAATACWAALALHRAPGYTQALLLLAAVNVGISLSDVACDAVMVETGKPAGLTGRFQAVQIGTLYLCIVATGVGGGWMAQHLSYSTIFGLAALGPLLIGASAFLIEETPAPERPARAALAAFLGMLRERGFWAAAAAILLWKFSPHQGTSFFYFQADGLGLSKQFIGVLATVTGIAGVLGAAAFHRLYGRTVSWSGREHRLDTAALARWSVLLGAPLTLLYLLYQGPLTALAVTALMGAVGIMTHLSLLDVAARSTPRFGEAAGFALFMALFNLAALASNWVGGRLYAPLASAWGPRPAMALLICLSTAATLASWPLLKRLDTDS